MPSRVIWETIVFGVPTVIEFSKLGHGAAAERKLSDPRRERKLERNRPVQIGARRYAGMRVSSPEPVYVPVPPTQW